MIFQNTTGRKARFCQGKKTELSISMMVFAKPQLSILTTALLAWLATAVSGKCKNLLKSSHIPFSPNINRYTYLIHILRTAKKVGSFELCHLIQYPTSPVSTGYFELYDCNDEVSGCAILCVCS